MTLTGLYVPLITPFDARGAVSLDALTALAHHVLEGGAAGVVALGTTGEPHALSDIEQQVWSTSSPRSVGNARGASWSAPIPSSRCEGWPAELR